MLRKSGHLIESLRSKNPKVRIVVAKAFPMKGAEEVTDLLNKKLLLLARPLEPNLPPVVVAGSDRGFDSELDLGKDASLPNAGGAMKIASTGLQ